MEETSSEWQSFNATVDLLKKNAAADNHPFSDNDLPDVLMITPADYEHYKATDKAPQEIFTLLYSRFQKYLPVTITKIEITETSYPDDPI